MKQPLHAKLIRDFILERPGRPFEEVQAYANEIGASQESLEEAVFEVSEEKVKFVPSEHSLGKFEKVSRLPAVSKKKVIMALPFVVAIIILSSFAFNFFTSLKFKNKNDLNYTARSMDQIPARQAFAAESTFSHQQEIDALKVFSYPSSGVTLKFTGTPKKDILGFFPYWMLGVSDKVNLTGVTEIAIFGLTSDGRGNIIIKGADGTNDSGYQMWSDKRLTTFIQKVKRRGVKVYITIKSFNNPDIESIVGSDTNQKQFIANALELSKIKSLDGIVIDFEYVGTPTQKITDDFTRLMSNLNSEMKRESQKSKLYICTYLVGAVAPGFADIQKLGQNSDKLVVMGYDVHTPRGGPGPVAPMNGNIDIVGSMEAYISKVDEEKVMLAVPYYGYDWVVDSSDTSSNKGVAYGEIQSNSKKAKILWDETSQTPYYFYSDPTTGLKRVLHFENARSLGIKYDYVKSKNIGGVAIWALGYDGLSQELGQLLLEKFAQ